MKRYVQRTSDALDDLRHKKRMLFALDHTRPGDEEQVAGANVNAFDLEGDAHALTTGAQSFTEGIIRFVPPVPSVVDL